MTTFWSLWIIVLTVITIAGVTWILFANRKSNNSGPDSTTGHMYDGIEEYDNPLPAWWLYMFVISIVFAIGYLIVFPGLGNWPGVMGWSQVSQWEKEQADAEQKYGAIFAEYGALPVEELATDRKALNMGRRLFANNCSQCHGSDARGSYGFPDLTDNDWLYGGAPEQIAASITHGRQAAMPAWGGILGEEGVKVVSQYVISLSGREVDMAMAEKGAEQFQAMCVACHGADGKGNQALGAPNLTDNIWLYGGSPGLVQRTVQLGRNGRMPAHVELLSADKIHLITAYVYSLSRDTAGVQP